MSKKLKIENNWFLLNIINCQNCLKIAKIIILLKNYTLKRNKNKPLNLRQIRIFSKN